MHDGPLDMRMDKEVKKMLIIQLTVTKKKNWRILFTVMVRNAGVKEQLSLYVKERSEKPIKTTFELVNVIKKAIPKGARQDGPHPAKRTFQAIRIEVNDELNIWKML